MIEKILTIQGIGKFTNFQSSSSTFSNYLQKVVAIYADNASGKTTLASILKSLGEISGENITRRKSFIKDSPDIFVNLLFNKKKLIFKKINGIKILLKSLFLMLNLSKRTYM